MSRNRMIVFLVVVLALSLVPMNFASAQDPSAPVYMRYCDRLADGDENIESALAAADAQLRPLEDLLDELDNGRRAFSEVIAEAEQAIADWDGAVKLECLGALNSDVSRLLTEVLISALYGQLLDTAQTTAHRQIVDDLLIRIRTESQNALNYMSSPIPTAEATEDETGPTPTATTAVEIRSGEELTQILMDFLQNNGISVLIDAGVQIVPGNSLIVIRLDKFVDPEENYDLPNTYFTLDALARLINNWPELNDITRIVIETYDGVERTLYVESTGADFRAFYYDTTITEETFRTRLRIEQPGVPTETQESSS